ncbi:LytTR family DNA-binding domain-containing protein [Pontibacter roseus]|uniref:LytTR family DNA-binding domain-containing protein n=1 Tax=Pontibacter roseus TaxID=336989 RepID=UPI000376AC7E|nr:LytTR family DNA-binding domain-containing protein [Pontibacter roseus]
MLAVLREPYPARDPRYSRAMVQALLSGSMIAFILVLLQPFGSYSWQHPYKIPILAGFGLVAVVGNLTDFFVTQKLFKPYFSESNWTVWKEILRNMLGFVLAGFLCVVYGNLVGFMPFTLTQVGYMIAICFVVGALPATVLILLNYAYLARKYSAPLLASPPVQPTAAFGEDTILELVAENEKDRLAIPAGNLLFISASDNYCTVYYTRQGELQRELLRSSLSRLESQMASPRIVRCHRSYLVNLDNVAAASGNAQGYKLRLKAGAEQVPVSRAYIPSLKAQLLVC